MHEAARNGHVAVAQELLRRGPSDRRVALIEISMWHTKTARIRLSELSESHFVWQGAGARGCSEPQWEDSSPCRLHLGPGGRGRGPRNRLDKQKGHRILREGPLLQTSGSVAERSLSECSRHLLGAKTAVSEH